MLTRKISGRPQPMKRMPTLELADLPDWCWCTLQSGADAPDHAFHTAVIATVREQAPEARTVVLRAVAPQDRTLWFHTDRRSAKVRALSANPRLSWVFWDAGTRIQLRCAGEARMAPSADQIDAHWAALRESSRSLYPGMEQFLPVACSVDAFDWLELDRDGHRRAQLRWHEDRWHARWIDP